MILWETRGLISGSGRDPPALQADSLPTEPPGNVV